MSTCQPTRRRNAATNRPAIEPPTTMARRFNRVWERADGTITAHSPCEDATHLASKSDYRSIHDLRLAKGSAMPVLLHLGFPGAGRPIRPKGVDHRNRGPLLKESLGKCIGI